MLTSIVPLPPQHTKPLLDCKFDPCGRNLLTASQDGHCYLYDTARSGEAAPGSVFKPHEGPILSVDLGPLAFGRPCVTGGLDGSVRVWKLAGQWQPLYTDDSHKGPVTCVAFSQSPGSPPTAYQMTALAATHPVGLHLASGSRDGSVTIHSLLADHSWARKSFVAHIGGVRCLTWATSESPRTSRLSTDPATMMGPSFRLVTGGVDASVRIWSLETTTGEWVNEATLMGHHAEIIDVAWRPNHDSPNDWVVSLARDGSVIFWSSGGKTWRLHQTMNCEKAERLSWSLDGALLGVSILDKEEAPVRVIREGTERGLWEDCGISPMDFVAKSPHVSFTSQPIHDQIFEGHMMPQGGGMMPPSNMMMHQHLQPQSSIHSSMGMQPPSMQPSSMQPPSMQPPSMQPPSMQPPSMQPSSMQPSSMQPPSMQPPSMQPPSMQPPSMQPPSMQPSSHQPPPMMGTQPPPPPMSMSNHPSMGQGNMYGQPPNTPGAPPPPFGMTPSTLPPSMMSSPSGMLPPSSYNRPPPPSYRPF